MAKRFRRLKALSRMDKAVNQVFGLNAYLELTWAELIKLPSQDALAVLNHKFDGIYQNVLSFEETEWKFLVQGKEERSYITVKGNTVEEAVKKISTYMSYHAPKISIKDTDLLTVV